MENKYVIFYVQFLVKWAQTSYHKFRQPLPQGPPRKKLPTNECKNLQESCRFCSLGNMGTDRFFKMALFNFLRSLDFSVRDSDVPVTLKVGQVHPGFRSCVPGKRYP